MQTMKDFGRQAGAGASPRYAEVWGDTVDTRHLGWSVLIGAAVSFGAFELALRFLQPLVAQAAMGRAYAMLVGLGGCLVAGAICARLFKPKRVVVEQEASDEGMRAELIDRLVVEAGPQGSIRLLPAYVVAEMKEAGLYDLFAGAEARNATNEVALEHAGSRGVA
ncbi:hypothetical protein [Bordetella sp. FB-8]|uniref:hypothetical protein n=1 Tax=Bordetella sp. FB-8 TaxID=1159870 RepID=UPI0003A1D719|nr:hypothetical protein [Bordetella sp. FB-8]